MSARDRIEPIEHREYAKQVEHSKSSEPVRFRFDGRCRVVIERVSPEIDAGRYAVKRVVGDRLVVEADLLVDGHDIVAGAVLYRREGEVFREAPLVVVANDRYRASFELATVGRYQYTVEGWVDVFATWRRGLLRKFEAKQDKQELEIDLRAGAKIVEAAATRATSDDAVTLSSAAKTLLSTSHSVESRVELARNDELSRAMARHADRSKATRYERQLEVIVDPEEAGFSAWYELFPRSCGEPGRHGTFRDVEARLPYVASMGFDVLYLPPIHPIGLSHRKGRNNTLDASAHDVGSPWAIGLAGAGEGPDGGGHKSLHPELGSVADFERLVQRAREIGLEIAIDVAFQASPDHPYVASHPEWFVKRPDGSIQYAENPPKKYQDVFPFDFESTAWRGLYQELESVFEYWLERGVRVFRVDNPHTKPLPFWEWCIRQVKAKEPRAIFLAEAFTRPKIMYALAKAGFTQSYTYFTWRESKREIEAYLSELTKSEVSEYFRPNFWPNTPDILPEHLQHGNRATFVSRLVLAATLSSNFGIYGPAFELMEKTPREGAEEYIDNEKFELKSWRLDAPHSLRPIVARVNTIRRENPALRANQRLVFHETDNDFLIVYSKSTPDFANVVLVVVNLDDRNTQSGFVNLHLESLGVSPSETIQVHDVLSDARYKWQGPRNFIKLDPAVSPAHVFVVRKFVRRENDFEYYL